MSNRPKSGASCDADETSHTNRNQDMARTKTEDTRMNAPTIPIQDRMLLTPAEAARTPAISQQKSGRYSVKSPLVLIDLHVEGGVQR